MKDVNKAPVFALKTFWIRIVRSPILEIVSQRPKLFNNNFVLKNNNNINLKNPPCKAKSVLIIRLPVI